MNGLENESQLFKKILDILPSSIYIKDIHGRYVWLNRTSIQQLEYKHLVTDSIIGKTDFDVFPKENAVELVKNDKIVIKNNQGICTEESIVLPNGQTFTQLSFKEPLYSDELSKIIGILGYTIDITEIRKSQADLEKTKHQLKGAQLISASIAHEIRTPLATIKASTTFVEYLIETMLNEIKEYEIKTPNINEKNLSKLKESINMINEKTDQSNAVINMLLTKLQGFEFGVSNFDNFLAVDCIEDALKEYTAPIDIADKIKFTKNNNFEILGNQRMVKHVIMNLLKNSVYFIQKSNKGEIIIWLENKLKENEIHFKDTAFGINEAVLTQIFKPFFTTETSTGTGVGLAFSKMVMESHQGNITCLSKEGEYTEFILSFPKSNT